MVTVSEKQKLINESCISIREMAPGTLLSHIVLAQMLDETPRTQGYYNMVRRLSEQLKRDHSIFISVSHKIGYVIAEPGQEIDIQDTKCTRATNQYVKAVKGMQYIDIDKIKDERLRQRTLNIAQSRANIISMLRMGTAEVKKLASG